MLAWFSLQPTVPEWLGFGIGWMAGWLAFWQPRPLPHVVAASRPAVAVIIPARNEAGSVATVVGGLRPRPGDEIVVVDDHSSDATAALAAAAGARVVPAPTIPAGWLGKPHACRTGVGATTAPVLVFLDADVHPPSDLLDRLGVMVSTHPDSLVSVQPAHAPKGAAEQLSLPFNIVALMGSRGVAAGPVVPSRTLAFGPVLACTRARYEAVGGHGRATVRSAVAEDIALGRCFGQVRLHTGRPDVWFRMFPGGWRGVVDGWTKHIAVGAARTPWWLTAAVVAWVWSQIVGWIVSPWFGLAAVAQLAVLARRVGRFSPVAVLLGPALMVVFTAVVVRSGFLAATGRRVGWKGRAVQPR